MRAVLTSLCAFLSAGLRPRSRLAQGIVLTLVVKVCVVVAMRLFVFGDDARVTVDPSVMDNRLIPGLVQNRENKDHD